MLPAQHRLYDELVLKAKGAAERRSGGKRSSAREGTGVALSEAKNIFFEV